MNGLTRAVTIATLTGTGVMAGLFFAFSTAVMGSLQRMPPAQGLAAMQIINVRIVNPVFMLFFMGSALACLALAVLSFIGNTPGRWWRLAGAVVFLIGAIIITMAVNVPLNDSLVGIDPDSANAAVTWHNYLRDWNPANHLRTVSSILATVLIAIGLPATKASNSAPAPTAAPSVQRWY